MRQPGEAVKCARSALAPQGAKADDPTGRVVGRANNNANANGGLVYANANNASSNSRTNNGARLAISLIVSPVSFTS